MISLQYFPTQKNKTQKAQTKNNNNKYNINDNVFYIREAHVYFLLALTEEY